jgi:hypothetical protein
MHINSSSSHCTFVIITGRALQGAFGNDGRFELTGQTAEKCVWKMVGSWAESIVRLHPLGCDVRGSVVILIGLRTLTNLTTLCERTPCHNKSRMPRETAKYKPHT